MRVISGTAGGLSLVAPRGVKTRPTADRVKEALFGILSSRVSLAGCRALDICAGTGSLGIEILSRGADTCCFIESDRAVLSVLLQNLKRTGFAEQASCLSCDARLGLQKLARQGDCFDVIFLDPPYASDLYAHVLDFISGSALMTVASVIVAECSSRSFLNERYGMLTKFDRRVYGDTALEFFAAECS